MKRLIASLLLAACLATPAAAQSDEIETVISSQIEAFLADDFVTAFSFASPMIRDIFRTPENFGAMVRGGYPMVWRPADVTFLELHEEDGALWQTVRITDAQGMVHYLGYQMVELENGWKINAVQVLKAPGLSA
ncbi:DUF4864 domain-containing protein [Ruegeria aquimaris]|uniref:DUF4864 domain-containing protein n=1 Tax=Ruegeria aquimaris TaxID=2984333 RepID=A0ABT3AH21_9RHOB|nr:DUF4864 domain-containing protein [Ruegeria sp. XHP0148]MCV2887938.1 DUF4864 domain-containing protein [Ruegeria sp. XHP0148]